MYVIRFFPLSLFSKLSWYQSSFVASVDLFTSPVVDRSPLSKQGPCKGPSLICRVDFSPTQEQTISLNIYFFIKYYLAAPNLWSFYIPHSPAPAPAPCN